MHFESPLEEVTLVRRYKRFLADVRRADGSVLTTHVANPGSMKGLLAEGARAWIRDARDPRRKLSHSLELIEADGVPVLVNTARGNVLAAEAIRAGCIGPSPDARAVPATLAAEQRVHDSRLDFLLTWADGRRTWCEVKMVTLATPPLALFPDARTTRGLKHLETLMAVRDTDAGVGAALLLVVARPDCDGFRPADDIDPAWASAFRRAAAEGVAVHVVGCDVSPDGVRPSRTLPVVG